MPPKQSKIAWGLDKQRRDKQECWIDPNKGPNMFYLDVKETYFDGYRDALDPVYKDPRGKIFKYNETNVKYVYGKPFYNEDQERKLGLETKKFFFRNNLEWTHVKNIVTGLNRVAVSIPPDGFCLPKSILEQVVCDVRSYTADTAFRQVALHIIKHPDRYYPLISNQLLETGESFESYCVNIFRGNVWGDDLIAAAFGDMWNIGVTLVAPCYSSACNLFHNKVEPDVVIIVNGGCWRAENKAATHFSPTAHRDKSFRLPGSSIYETHKEAESIAKVLTPTLLVKREEGRNSAITAYKKQEQMRSLKMLRIVSNSINSFNDKICKYIEQSDEMVEKKEMLEYQLQVLGVSVDKIEEAGKIDDRGFIRTEEREKLDAERKRKREQEDEDRREEAKRAKVIATVEGERRRSYENPEQVENVIVKKIQDESLQIELEHLREVAKQQKHIIETKTELLVDQDKEIEKQAARIRKMKEELEKKEKSENVKEVIQIEDNDDKPKIKEEEGSTSGSGSIKLEKMFKPEDLGRWIPGYKKPGSSQSSSMADLQTSSETNPPTTSQPSSTIYVPQEQQENVIVLQPTQQNQKTTERRGGRTHPVPKGRRKLHKFYCEKCKSEYSRKDLLQQHMKNDCLQPIRQFICDSCHAGYYSEKAVREHYYKIHLKTYLYYCTKCNKGFSHLNRKSGHKTKCPNPTGKDVYAARAPFDEELEKTFKRRLITIVPMKITDQQNPVGEQNPVNPQQQLEMETDPKVTETEVVEPIQGGGEPIQGGGEPIQGGGEVIPERAEPVKDEDDDDDEEDDDEDEKDLGLQNIGEINPQVMFPDSYQQVTTEEENATRLLLQMSEGGLGINQTETKEDTTEGEVLEQQSLLVEHIDQI